MEMHRHNAKTMNSWLCGSDSLQLFNASWRLNFLFIFTVYKVFKTVEQLMLEVDLILSFVLHRSLLQ